MRNAKKDDIEKFMKEKKLKQLGMPVFIGSGSEEIEGMKHRFLVMPRYGQDIWKIFLEQNRKFPLHTVYRLGIQLINILEYIHTATYVHMDLKGANILLGYGKGGDEQVYLLDYGLACHYSTKDYKADPKKAHNGTIEYTSRDAHNGVPTMRGDIEILAYNLIEWAGAKLPWTTPASLLTKPAEVQKLKEKFMSELDKSIKAAFGSLTVPSQLAVFMKYVGSMEHDTKPDYAKIRGMFESGLKDLKASNSGKLEFISKTSVAAAKSPMKRAAQLERKECPSPAKKIKESAGPSKVAPTKKSVAVAKSKVLVEDSGESTEEEPTGNARARRGRPRARYVEKDSDDDSDEEMPMPKKPNVPKAKEKSENKNTNSTEKSPSPSKKKTSTGTKAQAKGKVVLKSKSTGASKKTVTLNFDLDISYDSDLIVTVNRKDKDKKKKTDSQGNSGGVDGESEEKKQEEHPVQAGIYKGKYAKT